MPQSFFFCAACNSDKNASPEEKTDAPIMNETGDGGAAELKTEKKDSAAKTMDNSHYGSEETRRH